MVKRSFWVLCCRVCTAAVVMAGFLTLSAVAEDEGSDLYFSANALYNRKLYPLAIKEYREFLKKFPAHPKADQARLGLGLSYYSGGDYKNAEPLLASAVGTPAVENPGQVGLLLGYSRLQLGNAEGAAEVFSGLATDAAAQAGERADAFAGLVEALYTQRLWPNAITASDALWALDPTGPRAVRARFQGAAARHQLGKFKEAADIFSAIASLVETPELKHHVSFLLAECLRELGDDKQALKQYAAALEIPDGAFVDQALFRSGFVAFAQGDFTSSEAKLNTFIERYPAHALMAQALVLKGRSLLELARHDDAERVLLSARKTAPADADAALWLARVYSRTDRFEQAAQVLQDVASQSAAGKKVPREILFDLGNASMMLERYAEAANAFSQVRSGAPDWPQLRDALRLQAVCQHRAGDYAKSLAACRDYRASYPDADDMHAISFLEAENRFLTGARDAALPGYESVLANDSQGQNADVSRMRIAQILYQQKKWAEALEKVTPLVGARSDQAFYAQARFIAGDCHYNLSQWSEAVKEFAAFLKQHPAASNADTAQVKLALAELQGGNGGRAREALNALVSDHPESPHLALALVELGRLQYEAGDMAGAGNTLARVIAMGEGAGTERSKAEYYLAWVGLSTGKDVEAAQHFAYVIAHGAEEALLSDAMLQQGLLSIKSGDYAGAASGLREFLRKYPGHTKADYANFYLGIALSREKNWSESRVCFERILKKFPDSELADRADYEWAWCEKESNNTKGAITRYEHLLATYPDSALRDRVSFELAELESENGKIESAITRLEAVLPRLAGSDLKPQVQYRLGWCYLGEEQFDKCVEMMQAVIAAAPDAQLVSLAHYHAGEASLKQKEYGRSRDHFLKAVQGDALPDAFTATSLLRLGETHGLTSRWQESANAYSRYIAENAESEWIRRAYLGLGWARENMKQYNEALAAYAKVLEDRTADETAARAQFQTGECYFAMKDYDRALKELLLVEVRYAYPDWIAKSMLEMGRVLEQKGDTILAVEQYEALLQTFPDTEAATVAKGRIASLSE